VKNNNLSRRQFMVTSLKCLIVIPGVGLTIGGYTHADQQTNIPRELTPFVQILSDGTINLMIHKQEMGQGVRTSLAIILAQELDVELDQINLKTVDSHPSKYGRMDTGGSGTIRRSWGQHRNAGAAAREMLVTAASKRWGVDKNDCVTRLGTVINTNNNLSYTYGELSSEAALLKVPVEPTVKTQDKFNLIGHKHHNLDTANIVRGAINFGIDACPINTKHATIIRCPAAAGKIKEYDPSSALAVDGVIAVTSIKSDLRINGNRAGVGIVATSYWTAMKARNKVTVTWDLPPSITNGIDGLYEYLQSKLQDDAITVNHKGTPEIIVGTSKLKSLYTTPPQSQAHIEPLVCVAEVKGEFCSLWVGHQFPQSVTKRVAEYLKIPITNITLHPFRMGGSFGRKYENDFVLEAVQLAQSVDGPVKVLWSREDDMQFGFYQTPSVHELHCALDDNKRPLSWIHNSVTVTYDRNEKAPIDAGDAADCQGHVIWDIEHYRTLSRAVVIDINRGAHRSIGNPSAQFAIGGFQDEIAKLADEDSIAYFLKCLGKDRVLAKGLYEDWIPDELQYNTARLRQCVEKVAKLSRWSDKSSQGFGMGFSAFRSQFTYCATVVRVKFVNDQLSVTNIWNVTDCGQVIDLNGAEQQVIGSLVFGLSCALSEKIYSHEHSVQQSNFHQYSVAKMKDVPDIKTEFVKSTHHPTGLGEPAVSGVAPALGNAIYAATGKRIRSLPFSDHIKIL
jgi:isoquinoline 1-oxidoreductase beta subunit